MMHFSKGLGKKLGHPQARPPVSALWLFCCWGQESLTKGALGPAGPGSDKKVVSGTGPRDLHSHCSDDPQTLLGFHSRSHCCPWPGCRPRASWSGGPVWLPVSSLLHCLRQMLYLPGPRASSETSLFPSTFSDHGRGKGPSGLSGRWQAVTV